MTSTPDDLEALADRVEREEPSDALKGKLMAAIGWHLEYIGPSTRFLVWRRPNGAVYVGALPDPLHSLDAAASLVPEGWIMADLIQTPTVWQASLWREDETMAHAMAPTEPRARTAAALRAIATNRRAK